MSESSSSSSSEEELEEDKNWSEVTSKFIEETKKHQHETSNATCRLALVNLDWSKVKARDIYIMAKSFVPGDQILSVKIYQSETGKKQQALELSIKDSKDDSYEREQLRAYELSKLRWFYAILTFTSAKSSESIYESLDGQEYMSSGQLLDLSYVPESMEFDSNDV